MTPKGKNKVDELGRPLSTESKSLQVSGSWKHPWKKKTIESQKIVRSLLSEMAQVLQAHVQEIKPEPPPET